MRHWRCGRTTVGGTLLSLTGRKDLRWWLETLNQQLLLGVDYWKIWPEAPGHIIGCQQHAKAFKAVCRQLIAGLFVARPESHQTSISWVRGAVSDNLDQRDSLIAQAGDPLQILLGLQADRIPLRGINHPGSIKEHHLPAVPVPCEIQRDELKRWGHTGQ